MALNIARVRLRAQMTSLIPVVVILVNRRGRAFRGRIVGVGGPVVCCGHAYGGRKDLWGLIGGFVDSGGSRNIEGHS